VSIRMRIYMSKRMWIYVSIRMLMLRILSAVPWLSIAEELRGLAQQVKDNLEYSRSTDADSTGGNRTAGSIVQTADAVN
jgi:hypothetical protein